MENPSITSGLSKPSIICRICHMSEECERLLTPCMCKGTHAFVHQQCLEYWLSQSGLSHCELCLFHFATADHLRYGLWESMRIWFSHPSHRTLLQSDILLCLLLSIITFGLVALSMFCMYYLTATAHHSIEVPSHSRYWTEASIGVFLGI
ncbi:CLUMA_CG016172, isoform A, partial [Clunio marinus]